MFSACKGDKSCVHTKNPFEAIQDRIVGGIGDTTVPWHAYIQTGDQKNPATAEICGGTIINTKLVLTARHCFKGRDSAKVIKGNQLKNAFIVAGIQGNISLTKGSII